MSESCPRYLLACMCSPVEAGEVFQEGLPLHVTVQPWFDVPQDKEEAMQQELQDELHAWAPIIIGAGARDMFGPTHDVPVTKVARGIHRLRALHNVTADIIEKHGGNLNSPWVRERYAPHVSDRPKINERLLPEQVVTLGAMQLIKRELTGSSQTVTGVYPFGKYETAT